MAMVKLRENRVQPLVCIYGGIEYTIGYDSGTEIPLPYAINMLGHASAVTVEFTESDEKMLPRLALYKLDALKSNHPDLSDDDDIKDIREKLMPRKGGFVKKTFGKKPEVVEEIVEEEIVEEKTLAPLPPKLDRLTVAKLKILLEERGLSTEGKKADLIERLVEGA